MQASQGDRRPSDEQVARQILNVFTSYRVAAHGTLKRNYFLPVRDGDFQRGMRDATNRGWIAVGNKNRYVYELTKLGHAASFEPSASVQEKSAPPGDAAI